MDYEVCMSEDKNYVIARLYQPIKRQVIFEINKKMVQESLKYSVFYFLFDVRNSINEESTLGNYQIAYEDAQKVEFRQSSRFAVLHDPSDESHDFIKTVALNAGYRLELFTDEQNAIEWLCR